MKNLAEPLGFGFDAALLFFGVPMMIGRMMSMFGLVFVLGSAAHAAIVTTGFENLGLGPNSFNNDAGAGGQFVIDGNSFNNTFDPNFGWFGWALSSTTNTTVGDYTNQYSSITGGGSAGSATYAVAYTFGDNTDAAHPAQSYINLAAGATPLSVDVTNTTYAYFSMKNGDAFGNLPFTTGDYFRLDIRGYAGLEGTGQLLGDVVVNLALDANIVDTWQTVDLTSLIGPASLQFGLQSDETNKFGLTLPAYVAVDNLKLLTVPEPASCLLGASATVLLAGFAARGVRWGRHGPSPPRRTC